LILACGCAALIPARQAANQRSGFGVIANTAEGVSIEASGILRFFLFAAGLAVLFSLLALVKNSVSFAYVSAFAIIASSFSLAALCYRIFLGLGASRAAFAKSLAVSEMLALGGLRESYRLSRVASGTLAVALSLCVGISIMVESFRSTLESWITQTFRADVYVKAEKQNLLSPYYLERGLYAFLLAHPHIAEVSRYSARLVDVEGVPILVGATDFAIGVKAGVYREDQGSLAAVVASGGTAIAITESASRKLGLGVGDFVPFGDSKKRIGAIFRDYSSEHGMLLMYYAAYEKEFGELSPISLGLYLKSGSAQDLQSELRSLPQFSSIAVTQSVVLRDLVRRIFVDTFRITDVLEIIVLLMCGLGLLSSSLQRFWQRRRELELTRILGVPQQMLRVALLLETLVIALPGILAGLMGGFALSWILVYLINPLSFGWTIDWNVSLLAVSQPIVFSFILVVLVSVIGGRTRSARDGAAAYSE
jgi:putative ABC transport system permease protein